MAKMLFFNVPGHGHVNPSLPVVVELAQRGHSLRYYLSESFRTRVEAAGAEYRATPLVADDYFDAFNLTGFEPMRVASALMATSEAILPTLLAEARAAEPDLILFDGMCPWGYFTARALGVPAVASLALQPPPPARALLSWQLLRMALPILLQGIGEGITASRRSRALGRRYGVPPLGMASLLNATGDISLSYTSREFIDYADSLPDSIRFVGWTIQDTALSEPLPFVEASDRPLIYVSLGTLNNKDQALFRSFIEAFADCAANVLISTGKRFAAEAFGELPSHVAIRPWVAQTEVLKRAALFVSHGGLNSVHDALYLGVPLLLVPQQSEQALNSRRVVELGAGLLLEPGQANADSLRGAAARLLAEPQFRTAAQRLGDSLRAAGGAAKAADEVERLLASGQHQARPAGPSK